MKPRRKKPGARGAAAGKSSRKPATARRPVARAKKVTRAKAAPARAAVRKPAVIGADCTIEHARSLHQQLAGRIADRACVTLDLTDVKRCDTAGLQVLVTFIRERRAEGREVELKGMPAHLMDTARLLGLTSVFEAGMP